MQHVDVKLNPGVPEQKQHSRRDGSFYQQAELK
jgi:hypothetical protein